jgi:hypothetical protein
MKDFLASQPQVYMDQGLVNKKKKKKKSKVIFLSRYFEVGPCECYVLFFLGFGRDWWSEIFRSARVCLSQYQHFALDIEFVVLLTLIFAEIGYFHEFYAILSHLPTEDPNLFLQCRDFFESCLLNTIGGLWFCPFCC